MKGAHPVQRRGAGNVLRAIVVTRRRPTPQIAGGRRRVSALRRLGSLESPSHQAASSCSPISCLLPFHGTATQRAAPTPSFPRHRRNPATLPHKAVALATRRASDRESRAAARCGASPSRPCATPPLPPPVPTRYYTPQHHSEPKEVPIPQKNNCTVPYLREIRPASLFREKNKAAIIQAQTIKFLLPTAATPLLCSALQCPEPQPRNTGGFTPILPTPPPSRPQHTLPHKAVALATRRAGDPRRSRVGLTPSGVGRTRRGSPSTPLVRTRDGSVCRCR